MPKLRRDGAPVTAGVGGVDASASTVIPVMAPSRLSWPRVSLRFGSTSQYPRLSEVRTMR
jgi:hypothetical protein